MPRARDTGRARAIPSPSRRNLLAGASAALVAGAAIAMQTKGATTGADAELTRLSSILRQQVLAVDAVAEEGDRLPDGITAASREQERRLDEAIDARNETVRRIIETPATGPEGMRVKAEALAALVVEYADSYEGSTVSEIAEEGKLPTRVALSLARDVLAWRAA